MNKSPILVLGMHRSGTSCLAGCLQAAGLNLGDVNTAAPHNTKGNREHEAIRDIHDGLLAYNGYTWDRPPPRQLDWRSLDQKRLLRETDQFKDGGAWGCKDPRTIFCIKAWNKLFSPRLVATFRHPNAVADSLMKRAEVWGKPMKRSDAITLWVQYNTELLNITKGTASPYIRFDVAPDVYQVRLKIIADSLGLDGSQASAFYSERLMHETGSSEDVPREAEKIWRRLNERLAET